ncbi:unnamed protein product [Microthlaspi erraticum]|uniref:Uncharacterized protein n=1 Tax=Microthlaspi erraticum TaxID=1685480 RepID=A0A6D2K8S6_9BRAS|nr:unnamed protein product [Microthlaspi erraticum]
MTLEQKPAKGTSLTEALTVDRHASSAKFLRRLYRETAPNRAVRLAEKLCFALGQSHIRPTEVSAKVPNRPADHATRPGKHCPRSAKLQTSTPRRARPKRASRETRPRGRATRSRTTADASVRAGKERPTSGRETIGQIFIRPTTPADRESIRPDRSDSAHDPMSGRSSRTTVPTPRSTRSPF